MILTLSRSPESRNCVHQTSRHELFILVNFDVLACVYNTVQCSAVQFSSVHYIVMQCTAVQCSILQCSVCGLCCILRSFQDVSPVFSGRPGAPACLCSTVSCTLYVVHCTLYNVHCTVYNLSLYTVQLHSVQ